MLGGETSADSEEGVASPAVRGTSSGWALASWERRSKTAQAKLLADVVTGRWTAPNVPALRLSPIEDWHSLPEPAKQERP
jgi:hypothetical protein